MGFGSCPRSTFKERRLKVELPPPEPPAFLEGPGIRIAGLGRSWVDRTKYDSKSDRFRTPELEPSPYMVKQFRGSVSPRSRSCWGLMWAQTLIFEEFWDQAKYLGGAKRLREAPEIHNSGLFVQKSTISGFPGPPPGPPEASWGLMFEITKLGKIWKI